MTNKVIITVHGVGAAAPGATLDGLEKVLTATGKVTAGYTPGTLQVGGRTYNVRKPKLRGDPELAEVNWADVRKPRPTVVGLLRHLPALAVAALDLDHRWLGGHPAPYGQRRLYMFTHWLYATLLTTLAPWVGLPVVLSLAYEGLSSRAWVFGLGLAVLAGLITWVVRGWGWRLSWWVMTLCGIGMCGLVWMWCTRCRRMV